MSPCERGVCLRGRSRRTTRCPGRRRCSSSKSSSSAQTSRAVLSLDDNELLVSKCAARMWRKVALALTASSS